MIEALGIVGFMMGIGAVIFYLNYFQPMRDYLIEIKRYEQYQQWIDRKAKLKEQNRGR